jgi:hypothetical protein
MDVDEIAITINITNSLAIVEWLKITGPFQGLLILQ